MPGKYPEKKLTIIGGGIIAQAKADGMQSDYTNLGYKHCKILSPAQVKAMDPFLTQFCDSHSITDKSGNQTWNNDAVALYRPGGCLDTEIFLPKFYAYLGKKLGQYTNEAGVKKNCLQLKFDRNIQGVIYDESARSTVINGLEYNRNQIKFNKHAYSTSDYVFCPGEAVGTLKNLGFEEPAYSGFAGAALKLNIPIPADRLQQYSKFNHCMEVHQEGVVLAWQARFRDNQIFIGVAGTKAFYSDQKPNKDQGFAKNRNLLQLNMVNDVLPEFISLALQRDTKGQKLTDKDLRFLESMGIAQRWVGMRAVAYDGFPTLGQIYNEKGLVDNARCTTHLGSGGVSFAPAAVLFSRKAASQSNESDVLVQDVMKYASLRR